MSFTPPKRKLFTEQFVVDAGERALATAAQVLLTVITVMLPVASMSDGQSYLDGVQVALDSLPLLLLTGLGGALYSVLKSIVAAYKSGTDSASLAKLD